MKLFKNQMLFLSDFICGLVLASRTKGGKDKAKIGMG